VKRWHLLDEERERIRQLTQQGMRQSKIARLLGVTAPTVSKAQREMGLSTRLPIPEKAIMDLFKKGWGGHRISKHLGVAVSAVYKVAHANNFRRADNVGYPTPPENEARLIAALQRKEDFANRLAEKYKVGKCKTHRLAHEVLACPEFRNGAVKPALSSNFPQRDFSLHAEPDVFVQLVRKIADACFNGKLLPSEHDPIFVTACLNTFPDFVGAPPAILDCLASNLHQALHTIRALDNCGGGWTN
jgi:predicted transcriptional regulator